MLLLQAKQLVKTYGVETILDHINLQIRKDERIGLVGVNGAGKSTLLKVLTGELDADEGTIHWAKECQFGYLAQQTDVSGHRSLWEECMTVFAHIKQMERELRDLEHQMSTTDNNHTTIMHQYARLQDTFEKAGGYSYEARIRSVLDGLGLAGLPAKDTPVSTLSGGQKTRLALAKLLLQQPDLLMLDEPTNYLDLPTLEWLETFLQTYRGALLIVSHDRYFLDTLVQTVWELDQASLVVYHGNYTRFVAQKEQHRLQLEKQHLAQQAEIKRMETFIQKNIARASTSKRAQSRQKALEKMERIDLPPASRKQALIQFDIQKTSGQEVLVLEDASIGYADGPSLGEGLHLQLTRGERVALVGPNGVGKTTLLHTLAHRMPPLAGEIRHGANVIPGLYDQEQSLLHPDKQVLDELWDRYPRRTEQEIRTVLGHFLFSGDDVFKRVKQLSGGEKARLSLAGLTMKKANVLFLDEPTNHLDIYNKERLEEALHTFAGTLLFVSHDRYFINKLATRVVELLPAGLTSYLGNYDDFIEKKAALQARKNETSAVEKETGTRRQTFLEDQRRRNEKRRRRRQLTEAETNIEQIERQIQKNEELLTQPDIYTDYERAANVQRELDQLNVQLDRALDAWSDLAEDGDG